MAAIPEHLVDEILSGNCVAFVGAGFSKAARLPDWGGLLKELCSSKRTGTAVQAHVQALILKGSAHAFDEAAQVLEDAIGRGELVRRIRRKLSAGRPGATMTRRLEWLRGIPFRAILTTNFDPLLKGDLPSPESYRKVLRPEKYRWWEDAFWGGGEGAFVMKLHGDIELDGADDHVVLTRRDYRHRLYEDPAYRTFLKAVFASNTVLYLGFSFTDAYLNELRSEMLALLGQDAGCKPVAYAVANDVPELTIQHFRNADGVQVLSYDSRGVEDHSGFDGILRSLWEETNPQPRFARVLQKHRILWVDPNAESNLPGLDFVRKAARACGLPRCEVVSKPTIELAVEHLVAARRDGRPVELVITCWGGESALGLRLMDAMRETGAWTPTIVFAWEHDVERRKRLAMAQGALAYCFQWESLFREIERVFSPARETGSPRW